MSWTLSNLHIPCMMPGVIDNRIGGGDGALVFAAVDLGVSTGTFLPSSILI